MTRSLVRYGSALVAAAALALTACGGSSTEDAGSSASPSTEQSSSASFPLTFENADGTTTEIPAQPERIVSTAVTLTGGLLSFDAPVIASGAAPRKLGIAHEEELTGRGVSYCATCDGMFYKDKVVVVAGGGDTAAADALHLTKLCKKVYLVHRRDSLRAGRSYLEPLQQAENLTFVWNSTIDALLYGDKLTGIRVTDKVTGQQTGIDCDGLFVAVGRVPNTAFLEGQVALDDHGYIVADESTRTSLPGVFAAGDVRTKALRQVVTAAADGAVACHFIEEYLHTKA